MALETPIYINTLDDNNPNDNDAKSQGAAHLRNIKGAIKRTWPNVVGAILPTQAEINQLVGVTSPLQTQINNEIATRINQDALKANKASPTFTGTVTLPPTGASPTEAATKAYVDATAFSSGLPGQTGNAGKFVTTDGTNASWQEIPKPTGSTLYINSLYGAF